MPKSPTRRSLRQAKKITPTKLNKDINADDLTMEHQAKHQKPIAKDEEMKITNPDPTAKPNDQVMQDANQSPNMILEISTPQNFHFIVANLTESEIDGFSIEYLSEITNTWFEKYKMDKKNLPTTLSQHGLEIGSWRDTAKKSIQADTWKEEAEQLERDDKERMSRLDFKNVTGVADIKHMTKKDLITFLFQ